MPPTPFSAIAPAKPCALWLLPLANCKAYPATTTPWPSRRHEIESGLIFTGMVAIRDPLRDDVKEAVDRCRAAGIEVKMITGDNVETARAIAYNIGLIDSLDEPIDTETARIYTSNTFNALYEQYKAAGTQPRGRGPSRPLGQDCECWLVPGRSTSTRWSNCCRSSNTLSP
jgi:hypothetical protein